ncbi:mucoidy inhibitor MuiA family protein [Archangium violaceum]|uniref:mucoidy inhibitor MuiA family protein n=1 Tax=Archangium violaceum TaxID=83451 RepID=UPI00194E0BC8|nr:mucoidy inhibitor MuiA family protein [Archangium violaceum]QRN98759.1 mucoidy inhibitor MuiA family protein [Archangium violaceum]
MPVLGLSALSALWLAAVDAPVTSVTVYSDRARVVRTAKVSLSGTQRVELPLLYGAVDPSSIRVEAQGAEVARVDIRSVDSESLPATEARRLVTELERLDDRIAQARAEHEAYAAQLSALGQVRPAVTQDAVASNPQGKLSLQVPSRLDASGWRAATDFVVETTARLQAKLREVSQREESLERELSQRVREARQLGATPPRPGVEVIPTLSGQGPATLTLTYVTSGARWYPSYELRLDPASNRVEVAFSGRVSQRTGEDWEDAALTLSTALPATATTAPRLATWKIGQRERFIPTPAPVADSWRAPPSTPPAPPQAPDEDERLRSRLLALTVQTSPAPQPPAEAERTRTPPIPRQAPASTGDSTIIGTFVNAEDKKPPPTTIEMGSTVTGGKEDSEFIQRIAVNRPGGKGGATRSFESLAELAPGSSGGYGVSGGGSWSPPPVDVPVGLAPPEGWRRPVMEPDLPASLAGGHALAFPAQRRETVRSGGGERRVPLFTETWPVRVERKLYPALTPNAFLVAELRSPSRQVMPGGEAQLFVGADPAGQARLTLVSPGEPFTLPLGVDAAVRPVRNVKLMTSEKGFIGKDEITEYLVTIEVANPYPFALPVRIHDQWPLSRSGDVEVKLVRTEPYAEQDKDKGTLMWRLMVPPSEKTAVSFLYTVRHPKGWRLEQYQ